MSEGAPDVTINVKGPNELKLPITISTAKSVRDLKDAIADKSDVEAARQRLIYSGRVLKDDEPLTTYKIQSGHTIHMVKGVAPTQPESAPAQRLPAMQAGQNPADPLTMLNTPMAHGALAGFNPFADMGLNPNDPNMLQTMVESPEFMQQMSSMMQRPEFVEQMFAMDPTLRDQPQLMEMFRSPQFRALLGNPDFLREMMSMGTHMRQGGFGAGLGAGSGSGTPAPVTPTAGGPPVNLFGAAAASASGAASGTGAGGAAGGVGGPGLGARGRPGAFPPPPALSPALMQQLMASMGGGGGGAGGAGTNPWGHLGGFGGGSAFGGGGGGAALASSAPVGPPPEERYATQLQQLADMGFTNARQNVRALLATGGNVEHAVEYIFGGGGL